MNALVSQKGKHWIFLGVSALSFLIFLRCLKFFLSILRQQFAQHLGLEHVYAPESFGALKLFLLCLDE